MASMIPYDRYNRLARSVFPFDDVFDSFLAPVSTPADFKMDVEDAGDRYVISAHVPGVTRDQIDVELNEGRLSVSVDKKESDEEKGKIEAAMATTNPASRPAPGAERAIYQFSVLGSPLRSGAISAGGCTCRLRRS